jgi:hypothetical protein
MGRKLVTDSKNKIRGWMLVKIKYGDGCWLIATKTVKIDNLQK